MTTYADASALVKLYVDEPDSERARALLSGDAAVLTGRHSIVEVRRNLSRLLPDGAGSARVAFARDLTLLGILELDEVTCDLAASIAEQTGVRSRDALHLGAARRITAPFTFVTFDARQAQAARSLGFTVAGA